MRRPLDAIVSAFQQVSPVHGIAIFLLLLYIYPRSTIFLIACLTSFCFGLLFSESLVSTSGQFSLVENHYNDRIQPFLKNQKQVVTPKISLEFDINDLPLEPTLLNEVEKFAEYVVRDFINELFYNKINHSKSSDFPDSVIQGLKMVMLKLGVCQVNPTDLLLALFRVLISHVKEYKKFDLTLLDMKDYLETNLHSKFHRLKDRDSLIHHLREISMKLCVYLLPKSERSSLCGFAIVQEILATTVLLPILEKISQPDLINSALLSLLMMEKNEMESSVQSEKGFLNRKLRIDEALSSIKSKISFIEERIAQNNVDSFLVDEKIQYQGLFDELQELQGQEQIHSTPLNKYLDLKNCSVLVRYVSESESSVFLQSSRNCFVIDLASEENQWKVQKSQKDFIELFEKIKKTFTRVKSLPPSVNVSQGYFEQQKSVTEMKQLAQDLMIWLSYLVKDPAIVLIPTFLMFFQPSCEETSNSLANSIGQLWKSSSTESLQKAFNSSMNTSIKLTLDVLSPSKLILAEAPVEETKTNFTSISQEDLDVILDVLFSSFEELFSIDGEQWMTQQSLSLIKVILKRTFSTKLSLSIGEFIESLSSQQFVAASLKSLNTKLWPEGQKWGTVQALEKTAHERARTKHQLWCLLNEQEGLKKKTDFEKVSSNIAKVIGNSQTQKGFSRGFLLIQNQQLILGMLVEMLEEITAIFLN